MNQYTIVLICILTAVLLSGLAYFLCARTVKRTVRLLPLLYGFLFCVLGVLCYVFDWFGGVWLDLSGFIAFVLFVYGLLGLLACGAGYLVFYITSRRQCFSCFTEGRKKGRR